MSYSTPPSPVSEDKPQWQPRYYQNGPNKDFAEDIEQYKKGGFHPVHVDEMQVDRFEVVHKLGYGRIGTVWLLPGSSSHGALQRQDGAIIPDEHFWIDGPNGRHLCLVLPVLGMTVTSWKEIHHVAKGMEFLHGKGICYGDFRPSNILMKVKDLSHLTQEDMLEILGIPQADDITTHLGEDPGPEAPEYVVPPASMEGLRKAGLITNEIAIVDFGESYEPPNIPDFLGIPAEYSAPEQQKMSEYQRRQYKLEKSGTKREKPDVTAIVAGGELQPGTASLAEIERERQDIIGDFGFADSLAAFVGQERKLFYLPEGEERLCQSIMYSMPPEEALALAELVRMVFRYDMTERASATDVANHRWFQRGASP
ncbi:Uu.00g064590.m01.CDS01 [Anthostomella pinea]|uniref:EKC/KEOPS complex subunit BUD32 n=1 Tax=Anthostomella pinea TaxID=933095 RepID=A0AAI8YN01_9PEZI|nr:Uu.00g064590.m01.CDS01 [Anthostomella pinea]